MVTSQILWVGTLVLLALATAGTTLVVRLIPPARFESLRAAVTASAFAVWAIIWLWVVARYWDEVYGFFFPAWSRWLLPLGFGLFFAGCAQLLWRIARRFEAHAALVFVLLGAALGPATHLVAVWRGLMEKPPMLQGASPVAAVIIAAPEFALYWCIILLAAAIARVNLIQF